MRKPQGYATLVGPPSSLAGQRTPLEVNGEVDTFTCGHCQHIIHVPPKADPANVGGLCKQCMTLICPSCVDKMTCTPWELQMQIMEARYAARRSYGLRD